ncbi:MAG: trypsin-like serine protease [Sulfitobacter sp.]|nr:trypsin-like serine protease [Sulfitobacter sp.]
MTAAHCVEDRKDDISVEILFGSTDLSDASVAVADRVEISPSYWTNHEPDGRLPSVSLFVEGDIALVHTATALGDGVELATSVHEPDWDGTQTATVWGWGDTVAGADSFYPDELQTATVTVSSGSTAELCTAVSGPSACTGDSGGPLIVADKRGHEVLAGVISTGDTDCTGYTDYTRISAFRGWIDSITGTGEHTNGDGYWLFDESGQIRTFGGATFHGHLRRKSWHGWLTDVAPLPSGKGYWSVSAGGRLEGQGQLPWHPSGAVNGPKNGWSHTVEPVWPFSNETHAYYQPSDDIYTSIAVTPSGGGLWLFTTTGRVVTLGDAQRFPANGQTGAPEDLTHLALNGPIIDAAATPSGLGYYLVGTDGGVFTFGDAQFAGSMGGHHLNQPVISLVPDPDNNGYWLVASDGGVFSFNADFRGSLGSIVLNQPIVGMVPHGNGYLMVGADGGTFNFSNLPFYGSTGNNPPTYPVFAIASSTPT